MRTSKITRAISIRQPFVELILRGLKKREYRSKPTNIRERVYLYASLKPARWRRLAARSQSASALYPGKAGGTA